MANAIENSEPPLEIEDLHEFNGEPLNNASSSTIPSVFGLAVARKLWSDEELQFGCLNKQRCRGRVPLSPIRTNLFKSRSSAIIPTMSFSLFILTETIATQCGNGFVAVASAAVNQLGLDLKRKSRQRH